MSFKNKLSLFIVFFTTILIVIHQWIHVIPDEVQWIFFSSVLILVGIPHGALDHLVDQKIQESNQANFSHWKFHWKYLFTIALYIFIWELFPVISFVFFLLISAFHFGETDLSIPSKSIKLLLLQVVYGILLLLIFLFVYKDNAILFAKDITSFAPFIAFMIKSIQSPYFIAVWILFLVVFLIVYSIWIPDKESALLIVLGRLFFIYMMSCLLPFPISFAIYFGLWHSVISLASIKSFMKEDGGVAMTWIQLFQKAAPLALVSILGLFLMAFIFVQYYHIEYYLLSLFVGVSVLTLPHQHVMSNMYALMRKKKLGN